jgi:hypothetical protein
MRTKTKLFLVIFVIAAVTAACGIPFQPKLVRGSGDVVIENRTVSGFDKILVEGTGRIILTQGDTESLTVETDDNLMKYIRTEVKGDTLEVGFEDDVVFSSGRGRIALDPTDGFVFRISVIDLQAISVSGAADIEMEKIKTEQFDINLSGAGQVSVDDLDASSLNILVSGAGDVDLAGRVETQVVRLSGLGRYQAFNLESQEADVTISGAGGANVWVTESLDVSISGAGDVKYYGDPSVNPQISGVGRIQSQGEK